MHKTYPYLPLVLYSAPRDYFARILQIAKSIILPYQEPNSKLDNSTCLISFTVRSAFYAYLKCHISHWKSTGKKYAFFSGINIPHMIEICESFGIGVIPINLDLLTLGIDNYDLKKLLETFGENIAFVVIAHIYGRHNDISQSVSIIKKHDENIHIIEDWAESFMGWPLSLELINTETDISFFSFGTIKKNCADGGGLVVSKNKELITAMSDIMDKWQMYTKSAYAKKILKNSFLYSLLNATVVSKFLIQCLLPICGLNRMQGIVDFSRGFDSRTMLTDIQKSPNDILCESVHHQLFNPGTTELLRKGNENKNYVISRLDTKFVYIPGLDATHPYVWLFPICVTDRDFLLHALLKRGIVSFYKSTQLVAIPSELRRSVSFADTGKWLLEHVLYIPVDFRQNTQDLEYLCLQINSVYQILTSDEQQKHYIRLP